jgi:hypothetical protein
MREHPAQGRAGCSPSVTWTRVCETPLWAGTADCGRHRSNAAPAVSHAVINRTGVISIAGGNTPSVLRSPHAGTRKHAPVTCLPTAAANARCRHRSSQCHLAQRLMGATESRARRAMRIFAANAGVNFNLPGLPSHAKPARPIRTVDYEPPESQAPANSAPRRAGGRVHRTRRAGGPSTREGWIRSPEELS